MPSRLNGLLRTLAWTDFPTKQLAAPGPGQTGTVARTEINYSFRGVSIQPVAGTRPPVFQLRDTVEIDILLDRQKTWKASWLSTLPPTHQTALLGHERTHYKISALFYRDLFIEVMYMKPKQYSTAAAGGTDFTTIQSRYTKTIVQAVHDLYDSSAQTNHNPVANSGAQSRWDAYVQSAIDRRTPLFNILSGAGLSLPVRPASPVSVPVPYPTV